MAFGLWLALAVATSQPALATPAQLAKVAGGESFSLAVLSDGTVWAWGDNSAGQLGDGTTNSHATPVQVSGLSAITEVEAGRKHSVALRSDGTVWAWGFGQFGNLGNGTTSNSSTPVQVSGVSGATAIAAGGDHSLALKSDGTVWAWGDNYFGGLGDGTKTDRSTPVPVVGLSGASGVAAGSDHSLAAKSDGSVWAWGYNGSGQLGDGTTRQRSLAAPVSGLAGSSSVAAGGSHSLAILSDTTARAWGDNFYGELGDGTLVDRSVPVTVSGLSGVTAMAAGRNHSLAAVADGSARAWGGNANGQLGDATTTRRTTPVHVSGVGNVTSIGAGDLHSLVLRSADKLSAWGNNPRGELGTCTGGVAGSSTSLPVGCAPQATPVITATGGNEEMSASWWPAFTGTWPTKSWTMTVYDAASALPVAQATFQGDVTDGRVGGMVNDRAYFVRAYATNIAGDAPASPNSAPSTTMASPTRHEALGDHNPAELAPSYITPTGVNTGTGNFSKTWVDLDIAGRGLPLRFTRTFNAQADDPQPGPLGYLWTHSYNVALVADPAGVVTIHQENAATVEFSPTSPGAYHAKSNVLATLVHNGDGTFSFLRKPDQVTFLFSAGGRLLTETDRNGYATTLTYDSGGRLGAVTDAAGRSLTLSYDPNGRLVRVADPTGRKVDFGFDGHGDMVSVTDVAGGVTRLTYEQNDPGTLHHVLTMTDPNGFVVRNAYDNGALSAQSTDRVWRYSYSYNFSGTNDAALADLTTTVTGPRGDVSVATNHHSVLTSLTEAKGTPEETISSYGHDAFTMGVTSVADPNGHQSRTTWDAEGNLTSVTDALSRRATYTYNTFGEVATATDASGITTTSTFDARGNVITRSRPLTPTGQQATWHYEYDPSRPGDLVGLTDPAARRWSYAYDPNGDAVRATDALGDTSTAGYDAVGHKTTEVSPKGNAPGANPSGFTTTYINNAFGDVVSQSDPLGHVTSWAYDANRNLVAESDANGHTTRYAYNAFNERTQTIRPDASVEGTDYDNAGNVVAQTDPDLKVTAYGYDLLNRRVYRTDALNRTTRYGYDPAGNLKTLTDPTGRTTTLRYDAADQRIGIDHSDAATANVSFGYDALGQRITMADATGTSTSTYDSLRRLTGLRDGSGAMVSYGYDLSGRVSSLTYPTPPAGLGGARVVQRDYDAAGRLASVRDWLNHTTTFDYDADSNLAHQRYPNGVVATSVRDAADRLVRLTHALGPNAILDLAYGRDSAGLVSSENNKAYTHDPTDRLTNSSAGPPVSYAYDPADNLTTMAQAPPGATTTMAYDAAHQLKSITATTGAASANFALAYDADGNRTAKTAGGAPVASYAYDQTDSLVRATSPQGAGTYTYDGDGLRAKKLATAAEVNFAWDRSGALPVMIDDTATAYVNGPDGHPIEELTADGTVLYYHADQLASTRALTDQAGRVVATTDYDPYGNPQGATGAVIAVGYAGGYNDAESGLLYLRARYYDPATGQFLTLDPLVECTGQPYSYAGDSPLNATDPTGANATAQSGSPRSTQDHCEEHLGEPRLLAQAASGKAPDGPEPRRAAEAETGGATALEDAAQYCSVNSFTAATPVLLASGVEVPISKIHLGDKVLATDPETGQTAARPVTNIIVHGGRHTMVDVRLADGSVLTATDHHPFWDATTGRFTYAIDLHADEQVQTATGQLLTIAFVHAYDEDVLAYNLTVDGIHTYYAGTTPVLVHNSCGPFPDGARVTTNDALSGAEDWLGPNYSETGAGSGRFVSQDGTRVFRMGESDITGAHAGGPHVNFEELVPNPARPGRMMPVNGTHVYLIDP